MWKYRHSVKENPKSGYDWSATGQWQTAFCVCQREHWECRRPCAQSGRQSKNAPIESRDLMWNWHSLTDCTQNNLSRSPAHCIKRRRVQQLSETPKIIVIGHFVENVVTCFFGTQCRAAAHRVVQTQMRGNVQTFTSKWKCSKQRRNCDPHWSSTNQ